MAKTTAAARSNDRTWAPARAAALARTPGTHLHPTAKGFFMRVSPKLKAVWGYRFRDSEGEPVSGSLGDVAEAGAVRGLTLDAALKAFDAKQRFHKKGKAAGVLNLGAGFLDWHTNSLIAGGNGKKSPRTLEWYSDLYSRCLEAVAGECVLAEMTTDDWKKVLKPIKERSPSQAKGCYWILHAVYRRCVELDTLEKNPLAKELLRSEFSGKDAKVKRKTYIKAMDLETFIEGIAAIPRRGHGQRALSVLLLTGWRLNAVLQMRWDRIDFKTSTYTVLPHDEGWKGYVGPMAINGYAMVYLLERKQQGGNIESNYVFPAYGDNAKNDYMVNCYGSIASASKGLGVVVKPHDLRRTFITIAEIVLNGNMRLVGLLVAHKQPRKNEAENGTSITTDYVMRDMAGECESSRQVAEAILQIGGVLPMDDDLERKFMARGIDLKRIELVELEDDDEQTGKLEGPQHISQTGS